MARALWAVEGIIESGHDRLAGTGVAETGHLHLNAGDQLQGSVALVVVMTVVAVPAGRRHSPVAAGSSGLEPQT